MAIIEDFRSDLTVSSWFRALATRWKRFHHWRRKRGDMREARAAFLTMLSLDERILDDIGVTRDEVRWAASLPLQVNAASELKRLAAAMLGKAILPDVALLAISEAARWPGSLSSWHIGQVCKSWR